MTRLLLLVAFVVLLLSSPNAMAQVHVGRDYSGRVNVLLLASPNAMSQDPLTQHRRVCVKGLGKISVMVDCYEGEKEQARQLETEIELRLRQAGIEVGPRSAYLMLGRNHPDYPWGLCRIQANLQEFGKFERRHGFSELPAITWESSLNGTRQNIKVDDWESTRKVLMAAVDEFINDYLAANPQKQSNR